MDVELKEREKKVFYLTVYYFISGGEPVGSRFLSRKIDLDISPATVRNIMADLEERGLLKQTHPSSGRVPTDLGYRSYVELFIKGRKASSHYEKRIKEIFQRDNLFYDDVIRDASRTLSVISRNLGLAVGPKFLNTRFKQLQFMRVARRKVLAIFVTDSGLIQNRILDMEEDWSQEDLTAMSRMWNERFSGCPIRQVRNDLRRIMDEEKAEYDRLMKRALELGSEVLAGEQSDNLYMEGAANILDWPQIGDPERMKNLIRTIDEKERLLRLLDQSLAADGIQVYIGEEMSLPEMRDLSMITAPYRRGEEVLGVLGVIGPTRMHYAKVIPVVECAASCLEEYLSPPVGGD